jgi:hypothetical protein
MIGCRVKCAGWISNHAVIAVPGPVNFNPFAAVFAFILQLVLQVIKFHFVFSCISRSSGVNQSGLLMHPQRCAAIKRDTRRQVHYHRNVVIGFIRMNARNFFSFSAGEALVKNAVLFNGISIPVIFMPRIFSSRALIPFG